VAVIIAGLSCFGRNASEDYGIWDCLRVGRCNVPPYINDFFAMGRSVLLPFSAGEGQVIPSLKKSANGARQTGGTSPYVEHPRVCLALTGLRGVLVWLTQATLAGGSLALGWLVVALQAPRWPHWRMVTGVQHRTTTAQDCACSCQRWAEKNQHCFASRR